MDYTIVSHNDDQKTISIRYSGIERDIIYPEDIDRFEQLSTADLDLWVSGFILVNNDDVVAQSAPNSTVSAWIF